MEVVHDLERSARSRAYVEELIQNLDNKNRGWTWQTTRGDCAVIMETKHTSDGLRYLSIRVGQVVHVNGELRVDPDIPPSRINDLILALQEMKKWWKVERKRNLLPWWQRLARRVLFLS